MAISRAGRGLEASIPGPIDLPCVPAKAFPRKACHASNFVSVCCLCSCRNQRPGNVSQAFAFLPIPSNVSTSRHFPKTRILPTARLRMWHAYSPQKLAVYTAHPNSLSVQRLRQCQRLQPPLLCCQYIIFLTWFVWGKIG
jgi:hypothetical protein